eukprot:scaffold124661_cov33-Phaeocystis_antarctica.AAC.1
MIRPYTPLALDTPKHATPPLAGPLPRGHARAAALILGAIRAHALHADRGGAGAEGAQGQHARGRPQVQRGARGPDGAFAQLGR